MKYHFILNPVAGRGRAYKAIKYIRTLLRNKNIENEFTITNAPGHATAIANNLKESADTIVAIGGDGTINEIINGIINSKIKLGIIPLGSGNDFARSLNIPNKIDEAIDVILNNKTICIDIGKVKTNRLNQEHNERFFINSIGIGFDATVAIESKKINFLRGIPLYLTAVIRSMIKYKTPNFLLNIDNFITKSKYFLIAIGNGISSGGGFKLTPDAKLNDSKLDVCYVEDLNIFKIIKMLPSSIKGTHRRYKEVHYKKAEHLKIFSNNNFNVHADGEIVGYNVNNVEVKIIPNQIQVIYNNRI